MKNINELTGYELTVAMLRIGNTAVKKAQQRNREAGIPNVYSHNGQLYYELPNGKLTFEDPFKNIASSNSKKL
jgi:hypothetical protein